MGAAGPVAEMEYFAPCPRGLEGVCARELRGMGVSRVRPLKSGVAFFSDLAGGMRAALWSRVASRVLLVLDRVAASTRDELYAGVSDIDWPEWFAPVRTFAVDAAGTNAQLRNTQFVALETKDAICDRFRSACGRRPDVDPRDPDVCVNVSLHSHKATVALDLSGGSLHRRGYRAGRLHVQAPLKEALAAGVVALAGWGDDVARRGGVFVDPMCGSGTLVVEAAMAACDVAPNILRQHWCFENWECFDACAFDALLDEADERAEKGRAAFGPGRLFASDVDPRAVEETVGCLRRMRLDGLVTARAADVMDLQAPDAPAGLVATNPPYGERMSTRAQLPALYASLSARLREGFDGYVLAVITSDDRIDEGLGLAAEKTVRLFNGPLETALHIYQIGNDSVRGDDSAPSRATAPEGEAGVRATTSAGPLTVQVGERSIAVADPGAEQFAARLKKVYARRRRWARKTGVSCYRVYDADLPDFALAIDLFAGCGPDEGRRWVQVFEYAPPASIDPAKARRRLTDALAIIPAVLQVGPDAVFLKVRRRDRGGAQYAVEQERCAVRGIVAEDGLCFEVNLSQRLDCGLFLDHRPVRELIAEKARDARFLNLFAYTGTATVHAAAGGARATTTVDLSQTYLDWARRNMALNGFSGVEHEYVREDCRRFIDEQRGVRRHWDLVFVDPPTFSNSSKTGRRTFDVQRDHVELLIGVSRLLSRRGLAVFSCNLRAFRPDLDALRSAGVELSDITAQTIPEDFSRTPRVHHCYLVRRIPPHASGGEPS